MHGIFAPKVSSDPGGAGGLIVLKASTDPGRLIGFFILKCPPTLEKLTRIKSTVPLGL
jgi:hypothetical protein